MKAITVKFIGPTNSRGSRYKATAEGGHSVTLSADHALSSEQNHDRAAKALRDKMGWTGKLLRGTLPDGHTSVYVFDDKWNRVEGSPRRSRRKGGVIATTVAVAKSFGKQLVTGKKH